MSIITISRRLPGSPVTCYSYTAGMEQFRGKSNVGPVRLSTAASLAVALCLFASQGMRIASPAADPLAANSKHYFENSSPGEPAVTSPEKQTRIHTKTSRRLVHSGTLPHTQLADTPAVCYERALAESVCHPSMARSLPRDRAPPVVS